MPRSEFEKKIKNLSIIRKNMALAEYDRRNKKSPIMQVIDGVTQAVKEVVNALAPQTISSKQDPDQDINQDDNGGNSLIQIMEEIHIKIQACINEINRMRDEKERKNCEENLNKDSKKYDNHMFTQEEKELISIMFAEAGAVANTIERRVVFHVIINRTIQYGQTIHEVISAEAQFSGYSNHNWDATMAYFDKRDGSNITMETVINEILDLYNSRNCLTDITNGCMLYYSPNAMDPPYSIPPWNFDLLEEVIIPGVDNVNSYKFYKYK